MSLQSLLTLKKWKMDGKSDGGFTTRYMGHAPYSEIKLPAIDEHEMVVYMRKNEEI